MRLLAVRVGFRLYSSRGWFRLPAPDLSMADFQLIPRILGKQKT